MSAWKALSGELDPDVRTFVERLRLVIDRSGLGVVAVVERTGHDRADWDAFLHARRPVPRSAVVALSDITGADLGPLTAAWEHADRAWKRLLRERAVAEAGPTPDPGPPPGPARDGVRDGRRDPEGVPDPRPGPQDAPPADRTLRIRKVVPPAPAHGPTMAPAPDPAPAPAPDPDPAPDPAPAPAPGSVPRKPRRATPLLYAAGIAGAALVVTAAVLLADLGGPGGSAAPTAAPTPSATTVAPEPAPSLPDGVRCTGADCGGQDPERMGCGGPLATTVASTRIGPAFVEVRYSGVCAAAWARITGAAAGDEVSVQHGTAVQVANVPEGGDTDAYTAMIPVASGAAARACAMLAGGEDGCTGE
ncbi:MULTISPECIES: DUF2690 domain-containing protein [Streptomyces]|uniref:DUF2690 domain-containing protein n=2 Tax=Streptomyces TaxID=1883 RepID=A0ABU4K7M2_9ACTN|nr:DUF2690 domain-containing protein [Streptomyces roseolus]MDX2293763.1 DUF2690 domain-containing protein [Streptomyces roseolus]